VLKQALPGAEPGQKTSMRRPWRVRGYVLSGQENKAGAMVLAKTVTGQVLPPRPANFWTECRNSRWHGLCCIDRTLTTFFEWKKAYRLAA
jgi:hypothetical protein